MASKSSSTIFTLKNILNVVYLGGILLLLFNPWAKSTLIRALMTVGFFQPDTAGITKPASSERLPDVNFTDKRAKTLRLANHHDKVVFINFWATWCPPCLAEMPGINELYSRFKNDPDIVFITVDVDQNLDKSGTFLSEHHWTLPLYQTVSSLPAALASSSIPLTVIFDRNGRLIYRHEGVADYGGDKMIQLIQKISR